ncbi:hypothetical protein FD755_023498 [Muntiacus reevesi]|uniref:Crumbs cell polarity complex component 3 n=2 Tax=Muntiacus TaxID=9885 RepID=A0A5N3VZG8_MUNRE|nr:hypothetical protein FD755_023498 [Muntiacus reevesi]KAB0363096.1 hypothetical protein FD754_007252 [Muntiacus muntjak]
MASPSLGPLLALGLPVLLARWGRVGGQVSGAWGEHCLLYHSPAVSMTPNTSTSVNTTTPPSGPSPGSNGALSQEATTAIIVVFSLLAALLLAVGLVLLVRKLREKRQTEGTYRPSSEEQLHLRTSLRLPQEGRCLTSLPGTQKVSLPA